MANYVKTSTTRPRRLTENPGTGQAAVDHMIEFWKKEPGQALPYRPDAIVVPEACDPIPLIR